MGKRAAKKVRRRRAAAPLPRHDEALFRSIFERSPIGIAVVGLDGHPQRCNAALQRMLGYDEAELRRMSFAEFTYPDDVSTDLALFGELLSGERDQYQIEKRYLRKDG